ncbi:MAG TPA: immunoglobulin-like domain-containing protein [Tissierellaceae bacterium]|nr:immunoglobulin-like domain-containing protein [Tissierellaceae bacterium]
MVNNFDGISMNIKEGSVSSTKLTVIFDNNSDKQGMYSDDFLLESKIKGDWYQVPTIIDEYGFHDIGYELPPSGNKELTIDWDWLYGSLDTGEYRIIKKILDFRDTGDHDEYYLAAQFTID